MITSDQWIIPFNIINGLTRMPMHASMDEDLDHLPHVIVTSDDIWDPTVLDHLIDIENDIYNPTIDSNIDDEDFTSFDECTSATGSYLHHDYYGPNYICDIYHNECITCLGFDLNTTHNSYHLSPQHLIKDQDYEALHPYLLWLPIDHIRHTLDKVVLQCRSHPILQKSCFPATNVSHHNKLVTTDSMISDEPVLRSNATTVQISLGVLLSTLMSMELLLIMISPVHWTSL